MADFNMTEAKRGELMLLQLQMTEVMTQNAVLMAKILNKQRKRRQAKQKAEEKRREAEEKRTKKRRSVWVRKWLQRRPKLGQYTKLMKELKKEDTKAFRNFVRMDYETFHEILQRIEGRITKTPNNYRTEDLCLLV